MKHGFLFKFPKFIIELVFKLYLSTFYLDQIQIFSLYTLNEFLAKSHILYKLKIVEIVLIKWETKFCHF